MLIPLYFSISLLSAFLLFFVQPMAAKAVLPVLGGAPFVWNGCMLFFQTLLLGGYLYAHKAIGALSTRKQVTVHISLLVAALVLFPSSFTNSELVDAAKYPLLWLMTTLATSIAIPFFALSATAPMIQGWFSVTGHARSHNPYFLYSASNLGSFGSLLCYLVLVEPFFTRAQQLTMLHVGFGLLVVLFAAAGMRLRRSHVARNTETDNAAPPTQGQILYWLALSFVPSSLLYGVTQYITTDVASIPLLWVIPLSLYLLTFVLVFAEKPRGLVLARWLHIPMATGMVLIYMWGLEYDVWLMFVHMFVFFIVTMSCHGSLSEARPSASHLTNFYLWVSFGGVLGGFFNIFLAPEIFSDIKEYPLMLCLSVLVCVPLKELRTQPLNMRTLMPAIITMVVSFGVYVMFKHSGDIADMLDRQENLFKDGMWELLAEVWRMCIVVMLCFGAARYRMMNTAFALALLLGGKMILGIYEYNNYLFSERNIFGVNRVYYNGDINANYFRHGTTDHGKQSQDEEFRLHPVSYYGPLRMVFDAVNQDPQLAKLPIGLMGLGVGTIACYGHENQRIDIFEIDPLVQKIATNENLFTYMRDCPPEKHVEIGDARISISKKPDDTYNLIIADAFTSDAVPVHLLTLEAIQMYLDKVADNGAVAVHITNRHLGLAPVVSAIAHELNAHAYYLHYTPGEEDYLADFSEWVIVTRNTKIFERLKKIDPEWSELEDYDPAYLWRDDFSNIIKVVFKRTGFWGLFD